MSTYRFDTITLDSQPTWKVLDNGNVVIPAKFTRIGVFQYGDNYYEFRSPEEVFNKDSIQSMINKPLTNEHPDSAVTIQDWKSKAKGIITDAYVNGENVEGKLLVWDLDMIELMKTKKELSMGYIVELERNSGLYKNQKYDSVQRNIVYNHVSLVDKGRMGSNIKIDNNSLEGENKQMSEKKDELKIIEDSYNSKLAVFQKEIENLKNDNAKLSNKLSSYELEKTLSLVKDLGFNVDGAKSEKEIKSKIVTEFLNVDTKDQSIEFLNGAFDTIVQLKNKSVLDSVVKKDNVNSDETIIKIDI